MYTLTLFSIIGLIAGFAFGASASRTNPPHTPSPTPQSTRVVQTTPSPTPTATQQPVVALGIPQVTTFPSQLELANGTTPYSLSLQVINKQNQAVHGADITCKIWLIQQIPDAQKLDIDANTLKAVSALPNAIQGTVGGKPSPEIPGLNFDASTPQTGFCNASGQKTWKYTVTAAVPPGNYNLVTLVDWRGQRFNWGWINITIKQSAA